MTNQELDELLSVAPKPGTWWKHHEGGIYEVVTAAVEQSSMKLLVVYRKIDGGPAFARPLEEWGEPVAGGFRFTRIGGLL